MKCLNFRDVIAGIYAMTILLAKGGCGGISDDS
jgi:hypothetical protein